MNKTGQARHHWPADGTSEGAEVLLTPNEVRQARDQHPRVILFVLANVEIDPSDLSPVGYT